MLRNILLMAPRIKIDSKFSNFGADLLKHVRRFDLHIFKKIQSKVSTFTINIIMLQQLSSIVRMNTVPHQSNCLPRNAAINVGFNQ